VTRDLDPTTQSFPAARTVEGVAGQYVRGVSDKKKSRKWGAALPGHVQREREAGEFYHVQAPGSKREIRTKEVRGRGKE